MLGKTVLLIAALVACTSAHMSIFLWAMWGNEYNDVNSALMAQPLEDYGFNDWWWHGQRAVSYPPFNDAVATLPAGGTYDFEITGNKIQTSIGMRGLCKANPAGTSRDPPNPWDNGWNGNCQANVHAPKRTDVAGCALGIAYKSTFNDTRPEDFVIFSVVHDCVARPLQVFDIPALPACPNGKCMCAWFWIHNSVGGTDQMYMTPFTCNISNASTRKIGTPQPPIRCDGQPTCYLYPEWGNKTTTCRKPLQPMYWANNQGNNMANPTNAQCAPIYNDIYGFKDGNQDIFVGMEEMEGSLGDTLVSNKGVSFLDSDEGTRILSPHHATQVAVSQDGNVIFSVVQSQKILWSTKTANTKGVAPYRLVMQNDGDLVLQDSKGLTFWHSNTAGQGTAPYKLKVRDVNFFGIVDSNGYVLWEAKI